MRVGIRVKPGASRPRVGGRYGDDPPQLVVAVSARAVDGKANAAVVAALAKAFGVARRDVTIVHGATSRSKVVAIDPPDAAHAAALPATLATLLAD